MKYKKTMHEERYRLLRQIADLMRKFNVCSGESLHTLKEVNRLFCSPPLSDWDVLGIHMENR
jgi:hypothetical protein